MEDALNKSPAALCAWQSRLSCSLVKPPSLPPPLQPILLDRSGKDANGTGFTAVIPTGTTEQLSGSIRKGEACILALSSLLVIMPSSGAENLCFSKYLNPTSALYVVHVYGCVVYMFYMISQRRYMY